MSLKVNAIQNTNKVLRAASTLDTREYMAETMPGSSHPKQRGLRPVVHKTKSANDLPAASPTPDSDDAGSSTQATPPKLRIERSRSTEVRRMRDSDTDDDGDGTSEQMNSMEIAMLREMYAIKTLLANVMEVSPRGAQFERLLSRADAQVGNANSAVTKIVALDANMTQSMKDINVSLANIDRQIGDMKTRLMKCYDTLAFVEKIVMDQSMLVTSNSRKIDNVMDTLNGYKQDREKGDHILSRIESIEAMLLAIGNVSESDAD